MALLQNKLRYAIIGIDMKTSIFAMPFIAVFVSGCMALPRPTVTASSACILWQPLTYSFDSDASVTIQGIAVNNAKRAAFCQED